MGSNFQSSITEFDNDFNRKILNQTFSNESIVTQKLSCTSITNTKFTNCKFDNVDFTGVIWKLVLSIIVLLDKRYFINVSFGIVVFKTVK